MRSMRVDKSMRIFVITLSRIQTRIALLNDRTVQRKYSQNVEQ